jgi:hypothetical protein
LTNVLSVLPGGQDDLRSGLAPHEQRSGVFVDAVEDEYSQLDLEFRIPEVTDLVSGRRLLAQPDETLVSATIVAAARMAADPFRGYTWSPLQMILEGLRGRRLQFTEDDARLLFRLADGVAGDWRCFELLKLALDAAEQVGGSSLEGELARALGWPESLWGVPASDSNRLRARVLSLLPAASSAESFPLGEDPWAEKIRPLLDERLPGSGPLLRHLSQATASKPTKAWRAQAAELLPGHEELLRAMLTQAGELEPRLVREHRYGEGEGEVYREFLYLAAPNVVLVKGAVWAAGVVDSGWVPPVLAQLARRTLMLHEALANACVLVLGELSGDEAVQELSRLQAEIKHRGAQKRIQKALEEAAGRRGISRAQLLEQQVPTFGLDEAGRKEVQLGGWAAIVQVEPKSVRLTWRSPTAPEQRSTPAAVEAEQPEALKEIKAEVRELRKRLVGERVRLEGLLAEESTWDLDTWRRHYLHHPLVGCFARRLVWVFDGHPALGEDPPAEAERVELWHPIRSTPDEVAGLRRLIAERGLVQPFKQAYREVYLVAPAELETEVYSNRFAAHVLHYPQVYALLKQRGWGGNALGPWDGGDSTTVRRGFEAHGLRAEFYLEYVETEPLAALASLATTDQVRFYPLAGGNRDPIPLAEVPRIVFSEAMRDVDLFVGVASIAADPAWADRGLHRYDQYWFRTSFGELSESAAIRREVLAELVPKLKIADRLELEERFLRVCGDLRTYRIHLGSANILMEPNDQYLCIVPAPGTDRPRSGLFLPFDDDGRLNVILSKAFLLAADSKITDRSILNQIRSGELS